LCSLVGVLDHGNILKWGPVPRISGHATAPIAEHQPCAVYRTRLR
jgi:hypothetical protein